MRIARTHKRLGTAGSVHRATRVCWAKGRSKDKKDRGNQGQWSDKDDATWQWLDPERHGRLQSYGELEAGATGDAPSGAGECDAKGCTQKGIVLRTGYDARVMQWD
jgi:hypothetical protein